MLNISAWSKCTTRRAVDLEHITVEALAETLTRFYSQSSPSDPGEDLQHRNMLLDVRAAVNRRMIYYQRKVDVVSDTQFKKANSILEAMLKEGINPVLANKTQPRWEIIAKTDLEKISVFLGGAANSPEILRLCVWFQIAMHFPTRSLEFYVQLTPNSFTFGFDEQGHYAELNHTPNLAEKYKFIEYEGKRMYATYEKTCPVSTLRLLLKKTPPSATNLFNQCHKGLTEHPTRVDIWYYPLPLAKGTIDRFLDNICKGAGILRVYTRVCLWATAMHLQNVKAFREGHDVSQHSITN